MEPLRRQGNGKERLNLNPVLVRGLGLPKPPSGSGDTKSRCKRGYVLQWKEGDHQTCIECGETNNTRWRWRVWNMVLRQLQVASCQWECPVGYVIERGEFFRQTVAMFAGTLQDEGYRDQSCDFDVVS
eukprot:TRINITY_DN31136_c0_g1_i1.p1 TRINITY_DN31136_c0_g1~~TRINITY_DN31136_c0_g1_i1.p1  ORF type:complete len:128 (-),score=8.88 TRINITY_DN31136_c0_g1_i1:150-533(-)